MGKRVADLAPCISEKAHFRCGSYTDMGYDRITPDRTRIKRCCLPLLYIDPSLRCPTNKIHVIIGNMQVTSNILNLKIPRNVRG
jgi:hypothetical protein